MATFFDEEIEKLDQDVRNARARLVTALRARATVVDKTYTFSSLSGAVEFADLFGDKNDLIVVHNMGRGCRYCTLWADGINGILSHIEVRTSLVLISPDSPEVQSEFADSRGWRFRMLSDANGTFTDDMGFSSLHNNKRYVQPGFSTFHRSEDGIITRVGADGFGPGDSYMPVFPLFELLKDGDGGWEPQYSYSRSNDADQGLFPIL